MEALTFVECKHSSLGRGIVGGSSYGDEAGHTCNSHDVTLVRLDHVWTKGSASVEVAHHIDSHDLLQEIRVDLQDGCTVTDTSIVYKDGRRSEVLSNLVGCLIDSIDIGDIASDVQDSVIWIFGEYGRSAAGLMTRTSFRLTVFQSSGSLGNNIKHCNANAALEEAVRNNATNATGTSSDDLREVMSMRRASCSKVFTYSDLLRPVPARFVASNVPMVQSCLVSPIADLLEGSQAEKPGQDGDNLRKLRLVW